MLRGVLSGSAASAPYPVEFSPQQQGSGIGRGEQPITFLADLTNRAGGDAGTTYPAWPR